MYFRTFIGIFVCSELSVVLIAGTIEPKYKIHMVASDIDNSKPAIFAHLESPVWDPELQCLYFVDLRKNSVYRLDYASGRFEKKHIGFGPVTLIARVASSNRVLIGIRAALYLLDWNIRNDGALRPLTHVDDGLPDNVLRDGKTDAAGRFWFGTSGPRATPEYGTLYSIGDTSFTNPQIHIRPVSSSGGIEWALNNTVMYYVDSGARVIYAFDFDLEKGDICNKRVIYDLSGSRFDAIPQGLTTDTQGYLWIALMNRGSVLQINPDTGATIQEYKLPVSRITNLSWGGPNLDELFVTSALDDDNVQRPLAGAIFTLRDTGYKGIPRYSFKFDRADVY